MTVIGGSLAAAALAMWLAGYFALFVWMVGAGLGVPPGEDLLMASVGALVATGDVAPWVAIPLAVVAVVTSDTLLFTAGQVAQSAIGEPTTWWSDRVARGLDALVGRREAMAIATARFVPGLRTLVFVSVGARGMSRRRFVVVDACAAAVWVPVLMTCGGAIVALVFGDGALSLEGWL